MSEHSPRLGLPFILQAQAQKEVTHNEALLRIEALLQPVVQQMALSSPPAEPNDGALYVVASGASGAWAGQAGSIAHYVDGDWRFTAPFDGLAVWSADDKTVWRYCAGAWVQILAAPQPPIASATGGSILDAEARAAINSLLAACRAHGLIRT